MDILGVNKTFSFNLSNNSLNLNVVANYIKRRKKIIKKTHFNKNSLHSMNEQLTEA